MTDNPVILKEYEVLSEDRRRAVEIFLKGVIIATALIGFGFKYMLETKDLRFCVSIGTCGILFIFLCHYSIYFCRRHILELHRRLNEITQSLGAAKVIHTQYILNIVWVTCVVISAAWIIGFILVLTNIIQRQG